MTTAFVDNFFYCPKRAIHFDSFIKPTGPRIQEQASKQASKHFVYLFICLVTHDSGISHPKVAVEFLDGESAVLKAHTVTTHGHTKVTAIGNVPGLV